MALKENIKERLYELHSYRGGRVPVFGLRGLIDATEDVQGHNVSVPDFKIATFTAQASTPAAATVTGSGRIYGIWALSGTLSAAASSASNDAIVQVEDNGVVVASFKVKKNQAAEVYFFDSNDGIGEAFTTNVQVLAVAATGSGDPAVADRPDILLIYGDDTVNTSNANLINTNYG